MSFEKSPCVSAREEGVRRFDVDAVLMSLNAAQASHPLSMTPDQPLAAFETRVLPVARVEISDTSVAMLEENVAAAPH